MPPTDTPKSFGSTVKQTSVSWPGDHASGFQCPSANSWFTSVPLLQYRAVDQSRKTHPTVTRNASYHVGHRAAQHVFPAFTRLTTTPALAVPSRIETLPGYFTTIDISSTKHRGYQFTLVRDNSSSLLYISHFSLLPALLISLFFPIITHTRAGGASVSTVVCPRTTLHEHTTRTRHSVYTTSPGSRK